ncbi:MAG: GntR family transcriptional regulator [Clostridium sp.]|jgi:DNA-binding transcriptional regulator YhcF (GntR family)|uniref:GntR family transcriptional regulator n=1 Tax=Clostridium sp. TaxID=1506 RepID=UPI0025C6A71D|nr:GntR family transcriptional regulator [Clostridium sp.]MCH3963244.1 GntR family transcriptional regulator [Clostridium sp.]MCI1717216.1 GntR family transcriptional regulator [Clostridium sp.]MCI1801556.1 GntR family transcriptional regulator [Clostridium sp.]MCI1815402.1 GntR family transcriptional regulator [Clostridium sp.]MCI1872305.1 GntR family transcriptional regulator [Clostridium sp.]
MKTEFDPNIPIYKQIMDGVKRSIVSAEVKPGDKLLSIREMSEKLKVNPNTIQRAYQELERLGITYTQRGMGNFVKEDVGMVKRLKEEMAEKIIERFIDGMRNIGFTNSEIVSIVKDKIENENTEEEGK